ncbi:MAG: hypothetical protein LBQ19_01240, partial [Synergistaceae bacterium]|nr:hypothetical protein [Synergistaceae bacterium]
MGAAHTRQGASSLDPILFFFALRGENQKKSEYGDQLDSSADVSANERSESATDRKSVERFKHMEVLSARQIRV